MSTEPRALASGFFTLVLLVLGLATSAHAQDGKRLAVIIGNDKYKTHPLKNAVNDAELMDKSLRSAGFQTIVRRNANKADMEEAMVELLEKLGPDDTALFYYAGHGIQIENENFLIPVDFEAASSITRAKLQSFSMASVIEYLKRARPKRTILILDACRSNPVAESQSLQAGLAMPLNAGNETFIAFSTSPNHVASDNPNGRNSWFTETLGDLLSAQGLTIEEVLMRVGKRVQEATGGKQTPWSQSSLTNKFYFRPSVTTADAAEPSTIEKWMEDAHRREQHEDWTEAIRLVNQVLARKPGGPLEELARNRLPYLTARRNAQSSFDASDLAAAAKFYSEAAQLDPFAVSAARQAVNCYLLNDQFDQALAMLKAIRVRGTSAAIGKADALLKELAAVFPEAGVELKAGLREPPKLEEVFSGFRFGAPDWEAEKRRVQTASIDLSRWAAELALAYPPPLPAPPAETPAASSTPTNPPPVSLDSLHVEVITASESRDLKIRRTASPARVNSSGVNRPAGVPVKISTEPPGAELSIEGDPEQTCQSPCVMTLAPSRQVVRAKLEGFRPATRELHAGISSAELQIPLERDFGFVQFDGLTEGAAVLVDGKPIPVRTSRLQLPIGKYDVRVVQGGRVLGQQSLEITAMTTQTMSVR